MSCFYVGERDIFSFFWDGQTFSHLGITNSYYMTELTSSSLLCFETASGALISSSFVVVVVAVLASSLLLLCILLSRCSFRLYSFLFLLSRGEDAFREPRRRRVRAPLSILALFSILLPSFSRLLTVCSPKRVVVVVVVCARALRAFARRGRFREAPARRSYSYYYYYYYRCSYYYFLLFAMLLKTTMKLALDD